MPRILVFQHVAAEPLGTLDPLIRSEAAALWARQMTLGPTPEFCLQSARPVELPAAFFPVALRYRTVWPARGRA